MSDAYPFSRLTRVALLEYLHDARTGVRRSLRDELLRRLRLLYYCYGTWARVAKLLHVSQRQLVSYRELDSRRGPCWPHPGTVARLDLAYWSVLDEVKRRYAQTITTDTRSKRRAIAVVDATAALLAPQAGAGTLHPVRKKQGRRGVLLLQHMPEESPRATPPPGHCEWPLL